MYLCVFVLPFISLVLPHNETCQRSVSSRQLMNICGPRDVLSINGEKDFKLKKVGLFIP